MRFLGFSDTFVFPFDISRPMPTHADGVLADIVLFLEHGKIDYRIADGTLLGIYRDRKLIAHDTDLDFYLLGTQHIEEISAYLLSRGFMIGRTMKRWGKCFQVTFYDQDLLIVDFCVWHLDRNGDRYWVGPEISNRRVQPGTFFESPKYLLANGVKMKTFADTEAWLALVYGDSWKVPESEKGDWRESVQDFEVK